MFPYHYYLYPIHDDTQEPDEDEQSEESQPDWPWYYSHIFPPRSEPPPPPVQQTPPAEQSGGQASSSDSGGQGSRGASQTEDSPDTSRDTDEISAQATLPDIAEVQDDFGTNGSVDSVSWDRLHTYSNLDVIRVQQDIERCPLTYELCFKQSASFQSACEFIYADPEDVGGVEAIGSAWRLFQDQGGAAGGSSGDASNDVGNSGWNEELAHADSEPAEAEKRQPYVPTIGVKVSGTLRVYTDEAFDPSVDEPFHTFRNDYTSAPLSVIRYSKLNTFHVLVEIVDWRFWIDTTDEDAQFTFVTLREHGDTSTQVTEEVVEIGTEPGYEIVPIIPDREADGESLDIEISDEEWADRTGRDDYPTTKRGVLSRDYNHLNTGDNLEQLAKPFQLQAPVMGPDVRVEFVVRGHEGLGNYVVISFPAFVYQSNDKVMQRLEMQRLAAQRLSIERPDMEHFVNLADHNPNRWNEDGRIFYAFAHLSEIEPYIQPGEFIDSSKKAIIGKTGKTGTQQHHLDLAIVYFGSSIPGSGKLAQALKILRTEPDNADMFFGLVMRSQLDPNTPVFDLYGENLDSARLHPELDESGIAEFTEGFSIYVEE